MTRLADVLRFRQAVVWTPGPADIARVARFMRQEDRAEIFACRPEGSGWSDLAMTVELLRSSAVALHAVGLHPGRAIAILGAVETFPGVGELMMFATDEWPKVASAVTGFAARVMKPALIRAGWRRAECRAMAGRLTQERWLYHLGAREECRLENYGRGGETFVQFAWSVDHVHCPKSEGPAGSGPDDFGP